MINKAKLFLILFSFIFLYFICIDINIPYVGPNATNFNVYSLIAHNFNKFGYMQTKLTPLISASNTYPTNPNYFFHHPTLLSFTESVLFRIFGEGFWVGRLTVILFGLGSLFLIYFIGKTIKDQNFGLMSAFIFSVIPASTIFGKLIGQEPLVLFFCLLTLFLSLKYLSSRKKIYLSFSLVSIVLGILSDWPSLIFAFCLFPLFYKSKKIKEGLLLIFTSITTLTALLIYVYVLRNGFWDLQNAIFARSVTGLLFTPNWPIVWIESWIIKAITYFNPIIFALGLIYLYIIYKNRKHLKNIDITIFCLFLFGGLHEILYLQAVFSHNYLIYYLLPFFVFSSSFVLLKLIENKKYIFAFAIILFSIIYLFVISDYKNKQVESNVWRYHLAKEISRNLNKYETVAINNSNVVDTDLLWYPFLINWQVKAGKPLEYYSKTYKHYIYTCLTDCKGYEKEISGYRKAYTYQQILAPNSETYLFSLNKDQRLSNKTIVIKNGLEDMQNKSLVKKYYNYFRNLLNLPRI